MNDFKLINKHAFTSGDILLGAIDDLMIQSFESTNIAKSTFDILYCDPPWGVGALKMFDTLNSKMNNVNKSTVCWETFVNCFPNIINKYSHNNSIVIIEMSIKYYDVFKNVIERETKFKLRQIFNTNYKSGSTLRPLKIMYFSNENPLRFNESIIKDTYGDDCTDKIIRQCAYDNAVILDPCCGFGRTLRMANKYNMIFRGNEINKARLNKAIKYAERLI
tara:strand:+ start:3966 stop:4625 length:660 start_codon:yes stop_codon:yes gene_type:complete